MSGIQLDAFFRCACVTAYYAERAPSRLPGLNYKRKWALSVRTRENEMGRRHMTTWHHSRT